MTGWRDVIVLDPAMPDIVRDKATACLDAIEPWLPLGRLGQMGDSGVGLPVTARWYTPAEHVNWQGQSDYSEVRLNASSLDPAGEWEATLTHELVHVYDKHCLSPDDRARVMATVQGCLRRVNDECVEPLEPRWWDVTYQKSCGELLAFVAAQHIWYVQLQGIAGADLPMWGYYRFTDETVPTVMDVLAWTPDTPPQQPQQQEEPMVVTRWVYGEGADLLAAMSAARATGAAVAVSRADAQALIKTGASITVIGGPACTSLGLTWAVAGQKTTQGHITAILGSDYGDGLRLALA